MEHQCTRSVPSAGKPHFARLARGGFLGQVDGGSCVKELVRVFVVCQWDTAGV